MKTKPVSFKLLFFGLLYFFCFVSICGAKEITILYTGETHAMIYPCNCPIEPDGGIARRATLVRQLKYDNPDTLLLDTGAFFAGGLMDTYTQNVQLDMKRTLINLGAIQSMGYDALALGDDEFNFGKDFLLENIANSKSTFLSCNISGKTPPIRPYLVKEVGGIRIGIIGVTPPYATEKAEGLQFTDPIVAVRKTIEELKKNNTDIIILLSHLGEAGDVNLIKEVPGIDILFVGHARNGEETSIKVGSTILVRPSWQGRHLGKLSLAIQDSKIANYKAEEMRLSDLVTDDPQIISTLPACFSDTNCSRGGLSGKCNLPAEKSARCIMDAVMKIKLTIILPKDCIACETKKAIESLKASLPGIEPSYLYYPGRQAKNLINELEITTLPAYLLDKKIDKEKGFGNLEAKLKVNGQYFVLKPEFSGINYFLTRKRIEGKSDLFISLFDKNAVNLLETVKDLRPTIHFLAVDLEKQGFDAAFGRPEVEEYLRCACVNKYYPKSFWDYISCRAKNINSSWWQDCLFDKNQTQKLEDCARTEEGRLLLLDNIALNKEIKAMSGPAFLVNNQEIFIANAGVKKEALEAIVNQQ